MEEQNSFLSEFEKKEKLGTLKTLTVLTFIGSGLSFLGSIWTFANAQKSYEAMQKLYSDGGIEKLPAFAQKMYTPELLEVTRKSFENRLPLMIIGLIAAGLCLFGAIKMRQLKADGYWIWLIGEILPFLGSLFFVGAAAFSGFFIWIFIAIVLVFIILYTTQRKYLS